MICLWVKKILMKDLKVSNVIWPDIPMILIIAEAVAQRCSVKKVRTATLLKKRL